MSHKVASIVFAGAAALTVALAPAPAHAVPLPISGSPVSLGGLLPLSPASKASAVRKAESYLEVSAFSRTGLIKQLEYEKFSTDDATYAVDTITVDWNTQAAKKAKSYLELTGFSRAGLIDQLIYEGFTTQQASYGATAAGL